MKGEGMKGVYLAFMVLGSLVPLFLAVPHLRTYGLSPLVFIQHANATSAAAACFADIALACIVLLIFVWKDLKRHGRSMTDFWVTMVLIPIGLITALSYYLFRREGFSKPLKN